jgi:Flp pilus assembly protein TadG
VRPRRAEQGQATIELTALLPLIAVAALVAWQLGVAGHAAWSAGAAARAAARAHAVGADARAAAARVLAPRLRAGLRVDAQAGGTVVVTVPVPAVLGPAGRLTTVTSRAHFAPQR